MAAPKFPLKMGDGSKVRTLEQLRTHADLYDLEEHFRDRSLHRWLNTWDYPEAEAVEALDTEAEGVLDRLCAILGIQVTEEMRKAYHTRKENEHAKAEEERVKAEAAQKAESPVKPAPRPKLRPQMSSISDAVADKIANLLNREDDTFELIETENYVLFSSNSAKGLSKVDCERKFVDEMNQIAGLSFLSPSSSWYRISKKTGDIVEFAIQPKSNENMIDNYFSLIHFYTKYAVWGDQIIYEKSDSKFKRLIQLDVENQKISVFADSIETAGLVLAKNAIEGTAAFSNTAGLYLAKPGEITEITARGNRIQASALTLTEDALYFYCKKTAGLLDDASDPNGCYCRYDRRTGVISIVADKKKLSGLIPKQPYGETLFCSTVGNESRLNCWGTLNVTSGETALHKWLTSSKRASSNNWGRSLYPDGALFWEFEQEKGKHLIVYFADSTDDWNIIRLPDNFGFWMSNDNISSVHADKFFRLGQWIYYTSGQKDQRTRWKVSLDDPTHPIQL